MIIIKPFQRLINYKELFFENKAIERLSRITKPYQEKIIDCS